MLCAKHSSVQARKPNVGRSPRVRAGSSVGLGRGPGSSWMGVPLMSLAILVWEGSLWGSQEKLELWRKFEGE